MDKVFDKKVCLIASSGGHLEQIKQLNKVIERYNCVFVTNNNISTKKMKEKKYLVKDLYRGNLKILKLISIIIMFFEQLCIFIKENPDVIITTGAGIAIPMCMIGHWTKRKVIYIESFARMNTVNKSGKFIYKFADKFIVQWKELKKEYPDAIYGGWIY